MISWELPEPFVIQLEVQRIDIDAYDHVNNSVYMTWFDQTAWAHSASVGLPVARCLELDRGMAVLQSLITYLRPARLGDAILAATWILPGRSRLRIRRRFQILRVVDGMTLARADIEYACLELSTGRPARWPLVFRERYGVIDSVRRAEGQGAVTDHPARNVLLER